MPDPDPIPRLNTALEGRYRIERQLGEGGMATVYLARDERHNRNVALKVLKPELAAVVGAERFLAEIETTANLQHPHILPLFDSGETDGFLFYVMPYVEGETLRDRLDREHQLPVDEAVQIAKNVAEALHYAHSRGVIHRDVKPANILLQSGKPVVSDFGIALAVGAAGGRLTETGLSLGTPHYMSPEQATGDRGVGPAADTYSLGCVLYEMLVGEPPYTGSTSQAILGKIIAGDTPSASEARKSVPPHVDAAIARALEGLPADRFTSPEAMAAALEDPSFRHGGRESAARGGVSTPWKLATLALSLTTVTFAVLWSLGLARPQAVSPLSFYHMRFPPGQEPSSLATTAMDFSPDGDRIVYAGPGVQLWILDRERPTATAVPGTEGASHPFFSPDGESVAFLTVSRELKVIPLGDGPARTLVPSQVWVAAGGAWSSDGYIYYTTTSENTEADLGIRRIRADGAGEPESVTERIEDEIVHVGPDPLPDGRWLLFETEGTVHLADLLSGERRLLTAGRSPRFVPTGHVVFVGADSTLMAAPFDSERGELTGPATPIQQGVSPRSGALTMARSGRRLAYLASTSATGSEAVFVERDGTTLPFDPPWYGAGSLRVSPDGRRISAHRNFQIEVRAIADGTVTQLTFRDVGNQRPEWFPSGDMVAFVARQTATGPDAELGTRDLFGRRVDLSAGRDLLYDSERTISQAVIGADHYVIRVGGGLPGTQDVLAVSRRDQSVFPIAAQEGVDERSPALSPDGRYVLYVSDETRRDEIWVAELRSGGVRRQVSTNGGNQPVWNNAGDEIFYQRGGSELVAVGVTTEPEFEVLSGEVALFGYASGDINHAQFDVTSDDQRFVMIRARSAGDVVVVENFLELLERMAPLD